MGVSLRWSQRGSPTAPFSDCDDHRKNTDVAKRSRRRFDQRCSNHATIADIMMARRIVSVLAALLVVTWTSAPGAVAAPAAPVDEADVPSEGEMLPDPVEAPEPATEADPAEDTADAGTATLEKKQESNVEPSSIKGVSALERAMEPRYKGTGLLVTSALAGAMGLTQHIIAAYALKNTCGLAQEGAQALTAEELEDIGIADAEDAVEVGALGVLCAATAAPSLTLRLNVPVFLGASLGLATTGAMLRGRYLAYSDVFVKERTRKTKRLKIVGGILLGLGVAWWGSSRLSLLKNRIGCSDLACFVDYDLSTLHGSALLTITGAALLAQGLSYESERKFFREVKGLQVAPTASTQGLGLALSGAF